MLADSDGVGKRRFPCAAGVWTFWTASPGGRIENSPPFQGWGFWRKCLESRKDGWMIPHLYPSSCLMSSFLSIEFSRPFGTDATVNFNPAVNCRAIFKSPSGRNSVTSSTGEGLKKVQTPVSPSDGARVRGLFDCGVTTKANTVK